ncbi:hypothetical protein Nepgr_006819 [Nepenthes gracilis]|uniref:Uncharacterized protein n=1 Tax=Nepenthes gracilis TaxID=150966 RepID=A0AAD3XHQ7_NEPGR|nr:hypothetical protein Nepgr_006819 [Nepenthes gracilis]
MAMAGAPGEPSFLPIPLTSTPSASPSPLSHPPSKMTQSVFSPKCSGLHDLSEPSSPPKLSTHPHYHLMISQFLLLQDHQVNGASLSSVPTSSAHSSSPHCVGPPTITKSSDSLPLHLSSNSFFEGLVHPADSHTPYPGSAPAPAQSRIEGMVVLSDVSNPSG